MAGTPADCRKATVKRTIDNKRFVRRLVDDFLLGFRVGRGLSHVPLALTGACLSHHHRRQLSVRPDIRLLTGNILSLGRLSSDPHLVRKSPTSVPFRHAWERWRGLVCAPHRTSARRLFMTEMQYQIYELI